MGRPCFHCGDEDLRRLRRVAEALGGREDEVVERWARHYACAFGDQGCFSPEDFRRSVRQEIERTLALIRKGDLDGLASFFLGQGRRHASRGVPFPEVCRSLHLFEESVVETIGHHGRPPAEALELYLAFDHLSHERLVFLVEAYQEHREQQWVRREHEVLDEVARLERDLAGRDRCCGLVGRSLAMQRVYENLTLSARSRDPVLLVGPSGTGKELAARAIHALSGDPAERFVAVNCAALTHDLIESELFGHRRGAFSGADADHPGLFVAARGGTLFLDELIELAPAAQAKLLRALQERAVRPVGGLAEIPVEVRIVASTNGDLRQALEKGILRRDLYYRLQHLVIHLPPLRDRLDDLFLLVEHFIARANAEHLAPPKRGLTEEALAVLHSYPWPGNVRELESAVRLACKRSPARVLRVEDFPTHLLEGERQRAGEATARPAPAEAPVADTVSLKSVERDAIARALRMTEGNKSRAARLLGISRKQLYVKLRAYGFQQ